jgi:hypothetical protein
MGKRDWREIAKVASVIACIATVIGFIAKKLGE